VTAKRYVVAQRPKGGVWIHYLCAWVRSGAWVRDFAADAREIPVFLAARDQALVFDEETALQLVERLDERYRRVVRHHAEEVQP
jgi:hypothetical protein